MGREWEEPGRKASQSSGQLWGNARLEAFTGKKGGTVKDARAGGAVTKSRVFSHCWGWVSGRGFGGYE